MRWSRRRRSASGRRPRRPTRCRSPSRSFRRTSAGRSTGLLNSTIRVWRCVAAAFRAQQDPAGAPAGTVRRFDIPPGPIGDAIVAFQRLTAVTVTLEMESIGSIQSPGASGAFTVEEALGALLTGTGVRFRLTSPGAAVFELNPVTESVEVTGQATVVASPKYVGPLREHSADDRDRFRGPRWSSRA